MDCRRVGRSLEVPLQGARRRRKTPAQCLPAIPADRLGQNFVIPVEEVFFDICCYRCQTSGRDSAAGGRQVTQNRIVSSVEAGPKCADDATLIGLNRCGGRYAPGVKPTCSKALSVAETKEAAAPATAPASRRP